MMGNSHGPERTHPMYGPNISTPLLFWLIKENMASGACLSDGLLVLYEAFRTSHNAITNVPNTCRVIIISVSWHYRLLFRALRELKRLFEKRRQH